MSQMGSIAWMNVERASKLSRSIERHEMSDLCELCGKREGENHDLPGRCNPTPERLATRKERERIRHGVEELFGTHGQVSRAEVMMVIDNE